jgi:ATP-dependent DNA helicase RecQ
VLLLPGGEDEAIWRYFGSLAFPPEDQVRAVIRALTQAQRPLSTPALEAQVELKRARLELMLKVLDVDGAVKRVRGGWIATGEQWDYDTERHQRIAAAREHEQQSMRDYTALGTCRMEFLRRCLDDPSAGPCGRCDRCSAPAVSSDVSDAALASARAFLGRPGVEIEPRKMWPTGLVAVGVPVNGRIAAEEQAWPGRAVGRLTDLGWGSRLREVLAESAPDGPAPQDVLAAVVEVLKAWARGDDPWPMRPGAVAMITSRRRPQLIASVAEHVARVGRLPLIGQVALSGERAPSGVNSAQRVRALHGKLTAPTVPSTVAGPVLLVDDFVDSGWTMALAARELLLAGAPGVLPLTLAVSS